MTQPSAAIAIRAPSEREKLIWAAEPLAESLPFRFANGASVGAFACTCAQCDALIARERLRGLITNPVPSTLVVEALGYCPTCNLVTTVNYRIYDDFRIQALRAGRWVTWTPPPVPLWRRALRWLRTLLIRQLPGRS